MLQARRVCLSPDEVINFFFQFPQSYNGQGIYSASNRNEYQ
jgi:hypothetical protein